MLENQGADSFLGEPALDLNDFIRTDRDGRGVVNVLAADRLMAKPRLYATFLVWMLSELFESLPEVGDLPKPKLVFFFDEAHLLFNDAPKPLLEAVQQVVRLIRSKGVGVYFVTQNPLDVPEEVLGQLGNKVQHALRAFTPRDQKAVRAAAETFRSGPGLDTSKVIMELAVGEALVSLLEQGGVPGHGRPRADRAADGASRSAKSGGASGDHRREPASRKIRPDARSRERLRDAGKRRNLPEEPAQAATESGGLGGILGRITETLASSGVPVGQGGGGGAAAPAAARPRRAGKGRAAVGASPCH
jgi:DNA helicase HerA-like ATPase